MELILPRKKEYKIILESKDPYLLKGVLKDSYNKLMYFLLNNNDTVVISYSYFLDFDENHYPGQYKKQNHKFNVIAILDCGQTFFHDDIEYGVDTILYENYPEFKLYRETKLIDKDYNKISNILIEQIEYHKNKINHYESVYKNYVCKDVLE